MIYRKLISTMGICVLALGGATVQAGTSMAYFGGNLAALKYTEVGVHDDATLKSLYGRIGLKFNSHFSGELRAGVSLRDDTINMFGNDFDVELNNMYGAYIRGGFQANDELFPYLIIGYTSGELKTSTPGPKAVTESESDISLGFGVDFLVDNVATVNIEYIRYIDTDAFEVGGPAFGISSSF